MFINLKMEEENPPKITTKKKDEIVIQIHKLLIQNEVWVELDDIDSWFQNVTKHVSERIHFDYQTMDIPGEEDYIKNFKQWRDVFGPRSYQNNQRATLDNYTDYVSPGPLLTIVPGPPLGEEEWEEAKKKYEEEENPPIKRQKIPSSLCLHCSLPQP
jgi:hypothetical protein